MANEACLGYFGIWDIGIFLFRDKGYSLGYGIFTYYFWDMIY